MNSYTPLSFCTGVGQSDTRKGRGDCYDGISAKDIVSLVRSPLSVPKAQARWFLPSAYCADDARSHEAQRRHGEFWWLCADIDEGSPTLDEVKRAVEAVLGDVSNLIYSSRSSTAMNLKWRVLVPLAKPIPGADYTDTANAFFDLLEAEGLTCDRALARPGQLVYLPNAGEHYEHHVQKSSRLILHGHAIAQRRDEQRACLATAQREAQERREQRAAERAARIAVGEIEPIEHFNAAHSIEQLLGRYGYCQLQGTADWRSPMQTSGTYATRNYGDYWISLSSSDAAASIGTETRNGHRFGDAFDLYAHFEHDGNLSAAVREYAREAGLNDRKDAVLTALESQIASANVSPQNQGERDQLPLGLRRFDSDLEPVLDEAWLIEDVLPDQGLAAIYGAPGSTKTFAGLDMALAIGGGSSTWFGKYVEQGSVLYFGMEGGRLFRNRVAAYAKAKGTAPMFLRSDVNLDLRTTDKDAAAMIEAAQKVQEQQERPVAAIFVDTVSRALCGGNENSPEDMGKLVALCEAIRKAIGCLIVLIHHSGKDETRGMRGHTALLGAVDTEIRVEKAANGYLLTICKQRDGIDGISFGYRVKEVALGTSPRGKHVTSLVIEQDDMVVQKKPSLGSNQKIALEALRQFIDDNGVPTPAGTGWPEPGARRCIDADAFHAFLSDKMTSDNSKNRNDMARRAIRDLIGTKGLVQKNEGMLWIV